MIGLSSLPLLFALANAGFNAQWAPEIIHRPVDCIVPGQYLIIEATIQPSNDIRAAKVYFRSDKYPKFYFVEMAMEGNAFRSVIPKPSPETAHIVYYIEAVDATFSNAIGAEHTAAVQEACDISQYPKHSGEDPNIIVGATEAGLSKLPPGFEAAGIIGSLTSAGLLTGVGGGPGIGTAAAIAGAAAGAGGLAVAASGETETTTTVPNIGTSGTNTTTVVTTTVPVTTTTPGTPGSGPSSSTTTTTVPGSGTTTTIVPTTTTVPVTTTTPLSLTACFTFSDADGAAGCKVNFDASCSSGDIVDYEWRFQDNPPYTENGPTPTSSYDWTSDPACGGPFSRLVRLTVTGSDSGTAQTQVNVNPNSPSLTATLRAPPRHLQSSFQSQLLLPPAQGRLEAQVILNGSQMETVDNSGPHGHRISGKRGWNTVEGYLSIPSDEAVYWKFDFAASEHFNPGSIHVEAGVIATMTARSVVLRLSGTPGERFRLRYQLLP